MTTAIVASYSDAISVSFRSDAWFNATAVAANFGKRPETWLRTDDTKAYIQAIAQVCVIDEKQLVSVKRGSPDNGGGTWMHPKLGIPFARWLDPTFGVWCDMQIEKILHDRHTYALKDLRSRKALPGGLTLEQQDTIKEMVKARIEALPAERRGPAAIKLWASLKARFGCTYKLIPPEQIVDAVSLVARVDLEGESLPALAAPAVTGSAHRAGSAARGRERIDELRLWANRSLPDPVRVPFLSALGDIERSLSTGWTEVDEATLHIWTGLAMLDRWKTHS